MAYDFVLQFFFSTSVDGKIKAWLYDTMGSRVNYYAPGCSCAAMAYSADGKRYVYWNSYFHKWLFHYFLFYEQKENLGSPLNSV